MPSNLPRALQPPNVLGEGRGRHKIWCYTAACVLIYLCTITVAKNVPRLTSSPPAATAVSAFRHVDLFEELNLAGCRVRPVCLAELAASNHALEEPPLRKTQTTQNANITMCAPY